jgi:hypothetical protein
VPPTSELLVVRKNGGRDRDEHVVLDKVEGVRTKSPTYSPFASFFKKRDGTEDGDEGA